MSRFDAINLADLPPPDVIQEISWDDLLTLRVDKLRELWRVYKPGGAPEWLDYWSEADALRLDQRVHAYFEMLVRARVNAAARAVMLPFAMEGDLDVIAAKFGVKRVAGESNESLRERTQLAPEAFGAGGSEGAYVFHARSVDPVQIGPGMATAISTGPGQVLVTIMVDAEDPRPSPELVEAVRARLHERDIKPLTDVVTVTGCRVVDIDIDADVRLFDGPSQALVFAAIDAALSRQKLSLRRLGYDVELSGLYSAMHQPGVSSVRLRSPLANQTLGPRETARFRSTVIRPVGRGE